jgi:hypothetical protein
MNAFELKIQHQKDSFRTHLGGNQSFILLRWMLKIIELETFFWKLMIFWIEYAIVDNIEYF